MQGGRAMQDLMKRIRLLSVGLFYMGKEKIEETIAELIKKGEITEKEGRAMVNEFVSKSKAATKNLEDRVNKVMSDTQKKLHAPLKKEIDGLRKRIERLEKQRASVRAKGRKKAAAPSQKRSKVKDQA
jgi:polyhydroxyalkanoate synthesis regulator phasin